MNKFNTNNQRVFAKGISVSNNSRQTGLNNNDLIIGPSGAGKTTGYVIPNINQHYGSYIIADTKGNLARTLTPSLEEAGYNVQTLDFVNLKQSCRFNPLDYIRWDGKTYNEQDVIKIASVLCPVKSQKDPFWEETAQMVIASLICFVLEAFPRKEQDLVTVSKLFKLMNDKNMEKLFLSLELKNPNSLAVKLFKSYSHGANSEKTWSCILMFLSRALRIFELNGAEKISRDEVNTFSFEEIGTKPSALFVNVSDTDRSMDALANVFYYQAFQQLCSIADRNADSRLKVPVQIILDDFATNVFIPDFDKTISVIRSREISACLIIQSISQLFSLYDKNAGNTILNNCDHILYLGGQDLDTADLISARVNLSRETVLSMPINKAYFLERGSKCSLVDKIRPFANTSDNAKESHEKETECCAPTLDIGA